MKKIFQLDKFLTVKYMKELVQKNGFQIVNLPPELEQTLENYKRFLHHALQAPYIMTEEEVISVKIPVNQEEYYWMKWNIPKLQYLIKKNKILKTQIPMDLVNSYIQQMNNHPPSNDLQKDDKEIIILSYPPISRKYIILKGNKEEFKAMEKGEAFILNPFIHLQATSSTVYRSLFAVHFNYSLLCSYIAGQLTIKELEKRVFPIY